MDEKQLESLISQDWEEIAAKVTKAAFVHAARLYGWRQDSVLPGGKSVEDVVIEAIADLWADPARVTDKCDLTTQLKGIVKSKLWNLCKSADNRVARSGTMDEEHTSDCNEPSDEVDLKDEFNQAMKLLRSHPKVKAKPELQEVVTAFECGAFDAASIADLTNLSVDRVYQLQRELLVVYERVARELCEEGRAP